MVKEREGRERRQVTTVVDASTARSQVLEGPRPHSGEFVISYPRTQIFFGQNMKIHVYLGPVAIRMCWFLCCFTTEKKFQSWGVRAERSREGLRSAHLLGSCASGMAGGKILTHLPKTTGHAPSGHKTE